MNIPTKERLACVLDTAGLTMLAARARAGAFDDFESESPTPQIDLYTALRAAGRKDLAERVKEGEWDATKEEADAWAEREKASGSDVGRFLRGERQ